MAEHKKRTRTKAKPDVARPGKSAPSATSKSVILPKRQLLQDPMIADEKPADEAGTTTKITVRHGEKTVLSPSSAPLLPLDIMPEQSSDITSDNKPTATEVTVKPSSSPVPALPAVQSLPASSKPTDTADVTPEKVNTPPRDTSTPAKPETKQPGAPPTGSSDTTEASDNPATKTTQQIDAELTKQTEHEAAVQKLIDNKQYFLPINSVEKRKTKRFVALGILLSLVLAVAWVDIALDAGIIQLNGVKPVTHFFSN